MEQRQGRNNEELVEGWQAQAGVVAGEKKRVARALPSSGA